MLLGRRTQGLYYLQSQKNPTQDPTSHVTATLKSSYNTFPENLVKLWHIRLGHMPLDRMKLLFPQINVSYFKNSFLCIACHKARQQRLPFSKSCIKSSKPFEIIHVDI